MHEPQHHALPHNTGTPAKLIVPNTLYQTRARLLVCPQAYVAPKLNTTNGRGCPDITAYERSSMFNKNCYHCGLKPKPVCARSGGTLRPRGGPQKAAL